MFFVCCWLSAVRVYCGLFIVVGCRCYADVGWKGTRHGGGWKGNCGTGSLWGWAKGGGKSAGKAWSGRKEQGYGGKGEKTSRNIREDFGIKGRLDCCVVRCCCWLCHVCFVVWRSLMRVD